MILCENDELLVRNLEHEDKLLLVKWLSDSEVLKYYEGRDNPHDDNMVETKFYNNSNETRCIIEYSNVPIGYIQFYPISKEEIKGYELDNLKGKVYGMDQFLGGTSYWGQGIGTMLMKLIVNYLKAEGAKKILSDPQVLNERAIKCYEKSGFIKTKLLPEHELHE